MEQFFDFSLFDGNGDGQADAENVDGGDEDSEEDWDPEVIMATF